MNEELITPQKSLNERYKEEQEIKRFNWGAWYFVWFWGIFNKSFKKTFIPWIVAFIIAGFIPKIIGNLILFGVAIYVGINGNKWAWENKDWDSLEEFQNKQKVWAIWTIAMCVLSILVFIVAFMFFSSMFKSYSGPNNLTSYHQQKEQIEYKTPDTSKHSSYTKNTTSDKTTPFIDRNRLKELATLEKNVIEHYTVKEIVEDTNALNAENEEDLVTYLAERNSKNFPYKSTVLYNKNTLKISEKYQASGDFHLEQYKKSKNCSLEEKNCSITSYYVINNKAAKLIKAYYDNSGQIKLINYIEQSE